jgi:hypothetical protein
MIELQFSNRNRLAALLLFPFLVAPLTRAQQPAAPISPPSTARVYIYQGRFRAARANPIWCDGIEVAQLRQRWSYFLLQLPSGEHSYRGRHTENELILDLASGQDYYLRLDQVMEWPGGEKLVRERAEDGRALVGSGKLHPVAPNDILDRSRAMDHSPVSDRR